MPIRFHLDESVRAAVAIGLRKRGVDVTTSSDSQLLGASDLEHLRFALHERRVIVTHDDDFLRLSQTGVVHYGIVYCHQSKYSIGQAVLRLVGLWRTTGESHLNNAVTFL